MPGTGCWRERKKCHSFPDYLLATSIPPAFRRVGSVRPVAPTAAGRKEAIRDSPQLSPHCPCRRLGHLDQPRRRKKQRSLRAVRASGMPPSTFSPRPPPCHAEVPELLPYSSGLCMRGFSAAVVGRRPALVIGPRPVTEPRKKKPRPENSAFTASASPMASSYRLPGFVLGTRPPDHLPVCGLALFNLPAPGRGRE